MQPIAKTAAAVKRILVLNKFNVGGTLRIVGEVTTEKVYVMQPAKIVDGVSITALDPDNPAHWTQTIVDGVSFILDVNTTSLSLPYRGEWLISKEAGAGGTNAFGVRYV